jgi:hypothetical protein
MSQGRQNLAAWLLGQKLFLNSFSQACLYKIPISQKSDHGIIRFEELA